MAEVALPEEIYVVFIVQAIVAIVAVFFMGHTQKSDKNELAKQKIKIQQRLEHSNGALELMRLNLEEMAEYYWINKQQSKRSFMAALLMSVLGFALFAYGVLLRQPGDMAFSTIGGAIVEMIAGLFFWMFKYTSDQVKVFYQSLRNNERFLSAIELAGRMNATDRAAAYRQIVKYIIEKDLGIGNTLEPERKDDDATGKKEEAKPSENADKPDAGGDAEEGNTEETQG